MGCRRSGCSGHHQHSRRSRHYECLSGTRHRLLAFISRSRANTGLQFLVIDQILKGYSSFSLLSDEEVPEPLLANQGALSDDEGDHHEDDKTLTPDPASARHSKISFDKYEIGSPSWEDRSSDASPPPTINIQLPNAKRDYGTSRPSSPTGNRTPEYSC